MSDRLIASGIFINAQMVLTPVPPYAKMANASPSSTFPCRISTLPLPCISQVYASVCKLLLLVPLVVLLLLHFPHLIIILEFSVQQGRSSNCNVLPAELHQSVMPF